MVELEFLRQQFCKGDCPMPEKIIQLNEGIIKNELK